jgi:ABC-type transport system involved in multi-copper enzyme maturation permease subunit
MRSEAFTGSVGQIRLIGHVRQRAELRAGSCGSRQVWLIAKKEFNDRLRSGWVIACMALWLGAICLTSFFGLIQIGRIGPQGYERTVISLLNIVQYLVPLLGLLLGHDLIVAEHEERSLKLLLASGLSRSRLLVGKFLGGCLCLAAPLAAGFLLAGAAVGVAAKDASIMPFVKLAISGLGLGVIFVALGLTVSVWSRTRVQALVISLLAWCFFVFVFDLVALGVITSMRAPAAWREIDIVCDATHVNSAADIHSAFDNGTAPTVAKKPVSSASASLIWLAANPVDVFRVVNLGSEAGSPSAIGLVIGSAAFWLGLAAMSSRRKFCKLDL